jgi:hypothetical protein
MRQLQYIVWAIGLLLNVLVIAALLRGSWRKYRLLFVYAVVLLLATVLEIAAGNAPGPLRDLYYWADEVILDVLVFCLVISFIHRAAGKSRVVGRHWLIVGAALTCIASFIIHRDPHATSNHMMTMVSRDLNLCAVVLDLILWSALVAARLPDRQLLMLSGGLGLQLTGAIMGESIRSISPAFVIVALGSLLEALTSLLGLFIWWRALRTVPPPQDSSG